MKTVVILCGGNNSGKTTTLKHFFANGKTRKFGRIVLYERVLNGKTIYAFGLSSPQELLKKKDFCNVDKVKARIRKRTSICDEVSAGQDYTLIIPFGIYENEDRTELNEECVLKPIEWLKFKGFKVFPIYLRKENTTHLLQKDSLMKRITSTIITTQKHDYDKSEELENLIRNLP